MTIRSGEHPRRIYPCLNFHCSMPLAKAKRDSGIIWIPYRGHCCAIINWSKPSIHGRWCTGIVANARSAGTGRHLQSHQYLDTLHQLPSTQIGQLVLSIARFSGQATHDLDNGIFEEVWDMGDSSFTTDSAEQAVYWLPLPERWIALEGTQVALHDKDHPVFQVAQRHRPERWVRSWISAMAWSVWRWRQSGMGSGPHDRDQPLLALAKLNTSRA